MNKRKIIIKYFGLGLNYSSIRLSLNIVYIPSIFITITEMSYFMIIEINGFFAEIKKAKKKLINTNIYIIFR